MKLLRKLFPRLMSRKYSMRTQLFGIAAFFICIGSIAIIIANSQLIPLIYTIRQSYYMQDLGKEIETLIFESDDFYNDMAILEESNNIEVEIYDHNKNLVYDSTVSRLIQGMEDTNDFDLFEKLRTRNLKVTSHRDLSSGACLQSLVDEKTNLQYMLYISPIGSEGNVLKVYSQLNYIENAANATTRYVSFVAIITFALVMISLYLYLHHFTRPFVEMNKITRAMANMDFSQKCPPYSNNEIGELGQSINTLSASLDATMRDLKQKNEKLEADIEHERRVEKMRKEFVSNASHELKTPIAIIQGYAEGIKLGVKTNSPNNDEYCDVIIEETHKMNRLVCEMMELSKFESGAYPLKSREFDIRNFVAEVTDTYDILAEENGAEIIRNIPDSLTGYGDPDKLAMVLNNYVSNAIYYSKGEKKIVINATETSTGIKVSVFNTGDHIPEDEIPNIWLSFYRTDKAHSRAEGHFGIGLSIVKAIQELHHMPYSVENVEGGVEFEFYIKQVKKDITDGTEEQG